MIPLPYSKEKQFVKFKLDSLEVQAFEAYGIPAQPGGQKIRNVAKSLEESTVCKICRTDLSQFSLKLEKLGMFQKIPLDFRSIASKRKQVR